jgi:hypothetical protein
MKKYEDILAGSGHPNRGRGFDAAKVSVHSFERGRTVSGFASCASRTFRASSVAAAPAHLSAIRSAGSELRRCVEARDM